MVRRVRNKQSLFSPAGELIRKLSDADKRTRRKVVKTALWAVAVVFLYSTMAGTYSLPRIAKLELEKRRLEHANRVQVAELVDAERLREMLQNDPRYIEMIARTRYNMVRPGETLYRVRGY